MEEVHKDTGTNTHGILSLVFGMVSLLLALFTFAFGAILGIPALIYAIYAYKKATGSLQQGKGLEIAGIVTSSIATLLGVVVLVLLVIAFSMQ